MTNFNERTNTLLPKNISLTLYCQEGDVSCVWEVSGDKVGPKFFFAHCSTSFPSWLGLFNCGSLRIPSSLSATGSYSNILTPTESNRLTPGYIIVYIPPASAVVPPIYTLDWRLGRGSIYNTNPMSTRGELRKQNIPQPYLIMYLYDRSKKILNFPRISRSNWCVCILYS